MTSKKAIKVAMEVLEDRISNVHAWRPQLTPLLDGTATPGQRKKLSNEYSQSPSDARWLLDMCDTYCLLQKLSKDEIAGDDEVSLLAPPQ